ncbi:hypothetical protein [Haloarchaeobius iranensis]|uniref:Ig-like domain-containing protein n=1 Tax=Haloarchaeobius iranensis TaxID=996166 RepID=A0A1H0ASL5_9EURY|nr:hypothetical protein [Haloarchaeobius iranensis]SDN36329.1 hypothetical protein SAMN05192554_12926 [Haloarchaeobius iranensis]
MVLNHDSREHRLRVRVERDGEQVANREFDLGADEFSELNRHWSAAPAPYEVTVEDVETGAAVSETASDDPAEQEAMVGYRNSGELNVSFGGCCIGDTDTPAD